MADPPWPQFDAGRPADEYMPSSADVLAEIQAAEKRLREQHGERITRITVSPTLTPWLRRKFPPTAESLLGLAMPRAFGIQLVEDPSLVNGHMRIHRGDATEDWIAVPPDDPKWLVKIEEPVFDFPWNPA